MVERRGMFVVAIKFDNDRSPSAGEIGLRTTNGV